jgi:RHH-type proline utilization regulon transcriptional repressor/proline dehydrogenase/delta 1-pyrroline-5-carboxylate dehydrogenase
MDKQKLEPRIRDRGRQFFASIKGESPSVFNKSWWTGKVMDWCMTNEIFKVQLFRFVDVLPYLNDAESLKRHIDEYFGKGQDMPAVLRLGAGGFKGGKMAAGIMAKTIRSNIEKMARTFIIGEKTGEAVKNIAKVRKDGFAVVCDLLGEAPVSEAESDAYVEGYLELLDALAGEYGNWKPLDGGAGGLDWGHAPRINVSVKPSAFCSQARPVDQEGSIECMYARIAEIYRRVIELEGFMCIDMEQYCYKEMTIELFKRLRADPEFRDYPHLGLVLQSYLVDTDEDLEDVLAWARAEGMPISIRLVKGAYWDYETVHAKQRSNRVPVYTVKSETDAAFERHAARILENHDICHFACGSHNVRSIAMVMEAAAELGVPEDKYEFQVLYGMAEPVRKGLKNVAGRVRLYCPYGELIPGMAYLVRRLLENTANESFLKQSFCDEADLERLLEDPEKTMAVELAARKQRRAAQEREETNGLPPFKSEPFADFTIPELRESFRREIEAFRGRLGRTYPLYIGGKELHTDDVLDSVNPADTDEVVGRICQAGAAEVDSAMQAAKAAFPAWRDTSPEDRAGYLVKAAEAARKRIVELSAVQVLEVGKQWDQAYHDVTEAIDFLEYYAREMIRLGRPVRMGNAPGEVNEYFYEPRGVAVVIAPWNFPLAISCGMSSAAAVTGNCVLYKPSQVSSVIGWTVCEIFRVAGLPEGVFNYVPGRGSVIGDYMVDHPDVSIIAFTGSLEVGLRIQERAAKVHPGQKYCKKVVCEMGGKNGIIVDDDADLDEAVADVIYSAFGFQGQKCSACSRVIVLDAIYDRFMERLKEAAESIKLGPSEDPANYMGPVVDAKAQKSCTEYAELAKQEGRPVVERKPGLPGCWAPLVIVEGITPEHRIAQEEVFGPVLAVMRAKDFDQAIDYANATMFGLTGAIFSRSPERLERARREFRVGNLYLNRGSTGSLVGRQAFGGAKMSGVGTKAGGPDYLLSFMDPRCVTENTMRRGFAPIREEDDWVE